METHTDPSVHKKREQARECIGERTRGKVDQKRSKPSKYRRRLTLKAILNADNPQKIRWFFPRELRVEVKPEVSEHEAVRYMLTDRLDNKISARRD